FFFQAEDGIRDFHVTGVQTCALPIFSVSEVRDIQEEASEQGVRLIGFLRRGGEKVYATRVVDELVQKKGNEYVLRADPAIKVDRSEERRVGKEGRARWWS